MTRLRNLVLGGIAALAIGGAATSALAEETGTFQNRLNGATIGLPLGALPPAGLYTGLETAYLGVLAGSSNNGASIGNQCATASGGTHCAVLPAIAQAVPLLWVPGWNFLGATYGASVVQAFYNFETCAPGAASTERRLRRRLSDLGRRLRLHQHDLQPNHLIVESGRRLVRIGGLQLHGAGRHPHLKLHANPDYWTFEPALAISYLGSDWVLSVNIFYDINTASAGICCILASPARRKPSPAATLSTAT